MWVYIKINRCRCSDVHDNLLLWLNASVRMNGWLILFQIYFWPSKGRKSSLQRVTVYFKCAETPEENINTFQSLCSSDSFRNTTSRLQDQLLCNIPAQSSYLLLFVSYIGMFTVWNDVVQGLTLDGCFYIFCLKSKCYLCWMKFRLQEWDYKHDLWHHKKF